MLKRYKANSCVSLSVALSTDDTAHVVFMPQTGNGSVLYTDDELLQAGLEKHPKYGRLFKLENLSEEGREMSEESNDLEGDEGNEDNGSDETGGGLRRVEMSCNDDAKDYIADKFGVSRSKLKTRAQIEEEAKAHGIEIVWTDGNNAGNSTAL